MQRSDREFIEKYKQNQFEMHNPVPQKVTKEAAAPVAVKTVTKDAAPVAVKTVTKEAAPVAVKTVTKEAAPVAVQEAIQEAAPVAVQEAAQEAVKTVTKEAAQNDVQVAIQMVSSLKRQDDLADDENQQNPLELIQSALQQINYALHLLNGMKKSSSQEIGEKLASEPILPEAPVVSAAILPEAPVVSAAILPEAPVVSEAILPIQNPIEPVPASDYISDVDVDVEVQKEEEFKIVMPKKLKNKKTITTLLPVQEKIKTKKDEFPSLGSSFAPVKTGFWSGTVKKSLEIAKSIAHIPSPPPKKSIGMVRCGPSKDDLSEEEYSDTTEEYHIQKRYGEEDDDNWQ